LTNQIQRQSKAFINITNPTNKMGLLTWSLVTVLGVIGFAATGPVAGSVAAGAQSMFYGGAVSAGSWFAVAQSIAMATPI